MRSKTKAVLAMVVVVVAVSASASASAASWFVGGSELGTSASLAPSSQLMEGITWQFSNASIECTGLEFKAGEILAHNGGQVEHLVFTGCLLRAGTQSCALSSPKIESKPLKIEAALGSKSPEDTVVLKPVTGKVFAEYTIVGSSCALDEEDGEVEGQATFVLSKGREEAAEQELLVRGSLKAPFGSWTLGGKVKVKLSSGKSWSFH
jgi:hypothetical protein